MILLDGKETAKTIREELKAEVDSLAPECGRAPGLAVILVGEDPASQVYVRNKERACADVGITSIPHRLSPETSQGELEELIQKLNADDSVDGILLQLPLPDGLDSQRCLELIDPAKDVDGFHPVSVGKLTLGLPGFRSCTPAGVMNLLERYGIDPAGKKCVIVGRSNIVGKPQALMMLAKNATPVITHSRTKDLARECRDADILVTALGRPKFISAEMVKEGAVVVDVGINRTDEGLCGDCDFDAIKDKVSAITPVPGGVGPMTIAQLLVNTVQAYRQHVGA